VTLERLAVLDARRAFEATHRYEDLDLFHVPFDRLTGRDRTESHLSQMAANGGRVALIGPTGSGKSSVMVSVLGPLVEDLPDRLAPLRIPVAATEATTVTEPRAFAQHLVHTVIRYASPETLTRAEREAVEGATADTRRRRGGERTGRLSFGAPKFLADAGVATEFKSGAEEIEGRLAGGAAVAETRHLLALFREHGQEPFLVIDDSDSWLQIGDTDPTETANAFFTRIVPMLAKELDCGFVIAVHDRYLDLDGYRQTQSLFSTTIHIPRLEQPVAAIEAIFERRIELAEVTATPTELFSSGALERLAAVYGSGLNLRKVLAAADRSVQHATSDGVAQVSEELVLSVLAELA
jgi:energy-coupling factor transporter ATP-binding protein EcfA2